MEKGKDTKEKPMRQEPELLVFIKTKDLVSYILLINRKSRVKYRYSILKSLI